MSPAALFSGKTMHLREDELVRLQSPVSFHTASRSQLCTMPLFVAMVEKHPETYNLTEPTQNASHVMLLETSDEAAREVLEALMEPFCTTDTRCESMATDLAVSNKYYSRGEK